MSTPTTVKFKLAVSSTDKNGGAEQLYTLTLSLQAPQIGDGFSVVPMGDVPPPKDPPGIMVVNADPMGDIPPPKDPPKVCRPITLPLGQEGGGKIYMLELAVEGSGEIELTAVDGVPLSPPDTLGLVDLEIDQKAA